jgi:hypothetical protein
MDEDDAAEVAAAANPTHQNGAPALVGGPELAAGMRTAEVSQKIQRNLLRHVTDETARAPRAEPG